MTQTGTPDGWQDYIELAKATHALADKVRLNIVRILANSQEVNVTDLSQQLLISQPLVSWHLSILRRNGLVRTRRQGRQVYCSLDHACCEQNLQRLRDVIAGIPATATAANTVAPASDAMDDGASAPGTATGKPAGKPAKTRPARQF